jgi:hypothetical protein
MLQFLPLTPVGRGHSERVDHCDHVLAASGVVAWCRAVISATEVTDDTPGNAALRSVCPGVETRQARRACLHERAQSCADWARRSTRGRLVLVAEGEGVD